MAQKTATAEEPTYQETQRVAGLIEREVAGVLTETSCETIQVEHDEHLPPEVPKLARENGYVLYAVWPDRTDFVREGSERFDYV